MKKEKKKLKQEKMFLPSKNYEQCESSALTSPSCVIFTDS